MVKLKRLWGLLAMIMVAMLSISVVSCGDDDDEDDYQNPYEDNSGGSSMESILLHLLLLLRLPIKKSAQQLAG